MDILTQGLLGAVLARSVSGKSDRKLATLVGFFSGLLADADVLISSSSDPLLTIEYHRHFTHSIFFIPIGAIIALIILYPFLRKKLSPGRLYLYCIAGYSLSGVLDACTSYGTHLFWPLSDERIALNIISIVDPVFTLVLIITLVAGLRSKETRYTYIGLSLCFVYMLAGYMQLNRAKNIAEDLYAKRGHVPVQSVVKPTLGNLVLWRSVYIYQDVVYVDAIRAGLSGGQYYQGETAIKFQLGLVESETGKSSVLSGDINRFINFSNGFVIHKINDKNKHVIGDARYSMLPNSMEPLWGIVFDVTKPDGHADYRFFRKNDNNTRKLFIDMLTGQCNTPLCIKIN